MLHNFEWIKLLTISSSSNTANNSFKAYKKKTIIVLRCHTSLANIHLLSNSWIKSVTQSQGFSGFLGVFFEIFCTNIFKISYISTSSPIHNRKLHFDLILKNLFLTSFQEFCTVKHLNLSELDFTPNWTHNAKVRTFCFQRFVNYLAKVICREGILLRIGTEYRDLGTSVVNNNKNISVKNFFSHG